MTLQPLVIACPQCGSTDVFYSCEPKCCFNHVCSNCRTTFEPFTTRVGEVTEDFAVPPELEPTAPAAPCARCGEARVFLSPETRMPRVNMFAPRAARCSPSN